MPAENANRKQRKKRNETVARAELWPALVQGLGIGKNEFTPPSILMDRIEGSLHYAASPCDGIAHAFPREGQGAAISLLRRDTQNQMLYLWCPSDDGLMDLVPKVPSSFVQTCLISLQSLVSDENGTTVLTPT